MSQRDQGIPLETDAGIPVVDVNLFLQYEQSEQSNLKETKPEQWKQLEQQLKEECKHVAQGLHEYGVLIVKDPRVTEEDNNRFLDMLERYFDQPDEKKQKDVRPEYSYQVGTTPSFTELPKNHCDRMKVFKETEKPLSECPPEKDPKWRFFWRIGDRPEKSKYSDLNAEAVVPEEFPEWKDVMNTWGQKLLQCVNNVAEMAAEGFGLPRNTFSDMMNKAPHLLAPTATDLNRFGKTGTVAAGFHYDLNFLTIHGKSRYPGLYIWTRGGKKVLVRVPDGCLLVQAGKQFEYLTGGHVLAGFHEVVVVDETLEAIEKAKQAGRPLWRISSTLFGHIHSEQVLQPVGDFANSEEAKNYPPMEAGEQVKEELKQIKLAASA